MNALIESKMEAYIGCRGIYSNMFVNNECLFFRSFLRVHFTNTEVLLHHIFGPPKKEN